MTVGAIILAKAQRIYVTWFIQVSEIKCNHGQSDSKVLLGVPLTSLQLWLWACCLSKKRRGHQKARADDRHGELCRNNYVSHCLLPVTGRVYKVLSVHYLPSTKHHLRPLTSFASGGLLKCEAQDVTGRM